MGRATGQTWRRFFVRYGPNLVVSDVLSSLVFVSQCSHYIVSECVIAVLLLLNVHVTSQDMYGLLVNVGSHQFSEPLHALTNLLSVPLPTIRWGKYSLMSHWLGCSISTCYR